MTDSRPNIWQLQTQSDIPGLIKALSHSDGDIRRRAAIALRAIGASNAIPALEVALTQEKDGDVRPVILDALDSLLQDEGKGHQDKIIDYVAQLASDDPDKMIDAARELAKLKEKVAVEPLVMLFHNVTLPARVRLAAAEALIELESAPTEVTLLMALRHSDWQTRRRAAAVMGQLRTDWAVEPLLSALKDPHEMVAKTAYAALRRIQPSAVNSPPPQTSRFKTRPLSAPPVDQTQPSRPTLPARPKELRPAAPPSVTQAAKDEAVAKPSDKQTEDNPKPIPAPTAGSLEHEVTRPSRPNLTELAPLAEAVANDPPRQTSTLPQTQPLDPEKDSDSTPLPG